MGLTETLGDKIERQEDKESHVSGIFESYILRVVLLLMDESSTCLN